MDGREKAPPPDDILRYRVEQLEVLLAELRLEVHDEYLDRAQLMNEYVPRAEQNKQRDGRLTFAVVAATVLMAGTSITQVIVLLASHH